MGSVGTKPGHSLARHSRKKCLLWVVIERWIITQNNYQSLTKQCLLLESDQSCCAVNSPGVAQPWFASATCLSATFRVFCVSVKPGLPRKNGVAKDRGRMPLGPALRGLANGETTPRHVGETCDTGRGDKWKRAPHFSSARCYRTLHRSIWQQKLLPTYLGCSNWARILQAKGADKPKVISTRFPRHKSISVALITVTDRMYNKVIMYPHPSLNIIATLFENISYDFLFARHLR